MNTQESTVQVKYRFDKFYRTKWYPVTEFIMSFVLILVLTLPSLFNDPYTEMSGVMEVINEIVMINILWGTLFSFLIVRYSRKLNAFVVPFVLVARKGRKRMEWPELLIRSTCQIAGAILAAYVSYWILIGLDQFYEGVSTVGNLTASINGFILSWNGDVVLTDQYWFHSVQFIVTVGTMIGAILINIALERKESKIKSLVLWRLVLTYTLFLITYHVGADTTNTWKVLGSSIIAQSVGAAVDWSSTVVVFMAQMFGFAVMLKLYDWLVKEHHLYY